jgi:hypothetical protein
MAVSFLGRHELGPAAGDELIESVQYFNDRSATEPDDDGNRLPTAVLTVVGQALRSAEQCANGPVRWP